VYQKALTDPRGLGSLALHFVFSHLASQGKTYVLIEKGFRGLVKVKEGLDLSEQKRKVDTFFSSAPSAQAHRRRGRREGK
jgi:hypothetical protein